MGLDLTRWQAGAEAMSSACHAASARSNPGVSLGLLLGTCANHGIDKLTIVVSPRIYDLGAWLEQLIAESTGKIGRAIIPVDREPLTSPSRYGHDRLFVYVRLASAPDDVQDAAVEALAAAGRPVARLDVDEPYSIGGEFFRWEIATAVAGSLMRINPFDQPDVEFSKVETRKLTTDYEASGHLPPETPVLVDGAVSLFTDEANRAALTAAAAAPSAVEWLRAHLARLVANDYFALLAYVPMTPGHEAILSRLRLRVRDSRGVATCLGFGPRFLHSTGQAYKGGPNSGVFLQVTCDDAHDLRSAGCAVFVRGGQGRTGARRFPGPRGSQAPRAQGPSRVRGVARPRVARRTGRRRADSRLAFRQFIRRPRGRPLAKDFTNAAWHDWTWPDGLQHGPSSHARRASMRRDGLECRCHRGVGQGRSHRRGDAEGFSSRRSRLREPCG